LAKTDPEPPLTNDREKAADARAEADILAGRTISHEAMRLWLRSWGTAHELPPPANGD